MIKSIVRLRARTARSGVKLAAAIAVLLVSNAQAAAPALPPQLNAAQVESAQSLSDLSALRTDSQGVPTFVEANLGTFRPQAVARRTDAATLLRSMKTLLRADGSEALAVRRSSNDTQRGVLHYRMKQTINGLEVIGGEAILHVQAATSRVISMDLQFLSGQGLPRTPVFSSEDAIRNALSELSATNVKYQSAVRLAYRRSPSGAGTLVWVATIEYSDLEQRRHVDDVLADAVSGKLVETMPHVVEALSRQVHNFSGGSLLVSEGGTTGDTAAANVYQFSGDTYNYFWSRYGRDSWDATGAPMKAYVHGTPVGQDNATFNCDQRVAYFGDGYELFGPLSSARDIVSHEWAHGVTCSEANLTYNYEESGALNEAMSDIFGAAVEAFVTGVTSQVWQIGEDAYTPWIAGDAMRYMNNPAADGSSRDYYPDYRSGDDPHRGSGIGNLAFYLLVNGGSHPLGKTNNNVTGIGIDKASRTFYLALRDYLQSGSGYSAARDATARVAQEQYGLHSPEHVNTCAAWTAVGVPDLGPYCPPVPPVSVALQINGQVNGSITIPLNTPFNWGYTTIGASSCDLTGITNGVVTYSLPNFQTSFSSSENVGTPGNYSYKVVCRNAAGQTASGQIYFNVEAAPTVTLRINGQVNGGISVPVNTPFNWDYTSTGATSCDLTGITNGVASYFVPNFQTSFSSWENVGTPGNYSYKVVCRNASGQTASGQIYFNIYDVPPTVYLSINGQVNGSITVPVNTPFNWNYYTSAGATSCDLTGITNGVASYFLPNFQTSFSSSENVGTPGNYSYLVVCRNASGQTGSGQIYFNITP